MASTTEAKFILSAKDKTKSALRSVKSNLKGVGKAVTGVHAQILGLAGIGGFGVLVSGIIDTNKQMQTLKSSLKTVTGGATQAAAAFDQIEEFATTTPYELEEVVDSFIKLKALGLDPSERALTSYGNTAAAMGKSLNQMIEAVADASTGEFERLKEFGIKASKQGDQVKLTFQGVTTTIGNSSKEIQEYLLGIGENQFGGAMADQMNNIGPAFSNLGAAIRGVQVAIGEAGLNDLISGMTRDLTDFINALDKDKIEEFTHAALSGFADVVESIDDVYKYVSGNTYLQSAGIIGYLLFGKKGLALALGMDWVTNKMGRSAEIVEGYLNPSEVGRGGIQGYQLGDFNRSNGSIEYLEKIREMEAKHGQKTVDKLDEQNSILKDIAENVRERTVAVAG